jgi:TPR repeat protein
VRALPRIVWLAAVCAIASPVFAQTLGDALGSYERREYDLARQQFRVLAERGDLAAQTYLGSMYLEGGDCSEAVKWLQAAATRGFAPSQAEVGRMYATANCLPRDCSASESWLLKAAEQNEIRAQYHLGQMYETGTCVSADLVKAHMWFNIVAANFTADAETLRRDANRERNMLAAQMTPTQVTEAEGLARSWKPKGQP